MFGKAAPAVKDLGVDYGAGEMFHRRKGKIVRAGRFKIGAIRYHRFKRLRRVTKKRSAEIYFAGTRPGLTYGMDVTGCNPLEFRKLRRQGVTACGYGGKGHSLALSAVNCPTNDAGVYGASLCVSRPAKEWWIATDPDLVQSDGLGIQELRRAVNAAWHIHGDKKSWKCVAGLVGAAVWWMKCAQWTRVNDSEAIFQDDQGNLISMVDSPPVEVGKMFRNCLPSFSAELEVSKWTNK